MSGTGIGPIQGLGKTDYKGKRLIGKVVDNNDPLKLQRLKIQIPDVWGDTPTEYLPWCIPDDLSLPGNTTTCGSFGVPILNSILYVTLQDGDPHFPVYSGSPYNNQTKKGSIAETNYPNRYGFVDDKGNYFFVDRTTGIIEFFHKSGTKITINDTGTVQGEFVENLLANVTGNLIANVDGNTEIHCASILLDGNVHVTGNIDCDQHVNDLNGTMQEMRNIYNGHTHGGVDTGGGTTATTGSPMT